MLRDSSSPVRRIYLMAQFTHPRELTSEARGAIEALQKAGVVIMNQKPLIRGVNDDPETLAVLLNELSYLGVHPYYLFQCRPSPGNLTSTIPVEESFEIVRTCLSTALVLHAESGLSCRI